MTGFYSEMAAVVHELLAPDELGGLGASAGSVVLSRHTVIEPTNTWEDPSVETQSETLLAQVFGISAELVGLPADEPRNGVMLSTDRMVICAVPAGGYAAGDNISVDDVPVTVVSFRQIPAAGTPVALKMVIR